MYGLTELGGLVAGESVVVTGPGPIGLLGVAVAKALGAHPVILTGTRDNRLEIGKEHQFSAEAISNATVLVVRRSAIVSLAERADDRLGPILRNLEQRAEIVSAADIGDAIKIPVARLDHGRRWE